MTRRTTLVAAAALGALIVTLSLGQSRLSADSAEQPVQAPMFEVDPFWPKPLPNNWLLPGR